MFWKIRLPTLSKILYRTEKATEFSERFVAIHQSKRRHITANAAVLNVTCLHAVKHSYCWRM